MGLLRAFALWGAKRRRGWVSRFSDWHSGNGCQCQGAGKLRVEDITGMMDTFIMLGAFLAAGLAGRFAPNLNIPRRSLVAAIIGGLMLGYGARLAYGCNIGAYFSGIASGSLHGWLWLVAAFFGNSVGVYLRPWFFPGERQPNTECLLRAAAMTGAGRRVRP